MLGRYRYTASTLTQGEDIEIVGRLHYFALIIPSLLTIISFCTFILVLGYTPEMNSADKIIAWLIVAILLIFTATSWLKRNMIEMVCTNKRVVKRTGIINVTTEELHRERIESVEIRQSFFGRIFNYGDILFSGTGTSKIVFRFVNQPRLMKQVIDAIINRPINLEPSI